MILIYFFLLTFIVCTLRLHFYLNGAKFSLFDRILAINPIIINILFLFTSLIFIFIISPICGILDSSMPIVIESISLEKFLTWLQEQSKKFF